MQIADIAIIAYSLFQILGIFFVSRAIFRMVIARRQELAKQEVRHDRRNSG